MTLNYNAFVVSKDLGWKSTGNEWYNISRMKEECFCLSLKSMKWWYWWLWHLH